MIDWGSSKMKITNHLLSFINFDMYFLSSLLFDYFVCIVTHTYRNFHDSQQERLKVKIIKDKLSL